MDIFSCAFVAVIALVLPLGLALFFSIKKKKLLPILLGALTFTIFQLFLRLPLLQLVLPNMSWFSIMTSLNPLLSALFFGFSAALFEEGGRYIVMRLFMKNHHSFLDGIAFGIGHGGIEAIILVGINAIATLFLANSMIIPTDMFLAGFERLSTMIVHVAWSVMVLKSISDKRPLWLLLAFMLHGIIDSGVVILQSKGLQALTIEILIVIFALTMLAFLIYEYHKIKTSKDLIT